MCAGTRFTRNIWGECVRSGRGAFAPLELRRVPEVNHLLTGLGLGELRSEGVDSLLGRNENWAGTTSAGFGVFVKHLDRGGTDAVERIHRSRAFDSLIRQARRAGLSTPELIGYDEDARILVFDLVKDGRTLAEHFADGGVEDEWSGRAGHAIGTLHCLGSAGAALPLDTSPFPFPDLRLLQALPLPSYLGLTFAEVTLWNILQGDAVLAEALAALRRSEEEAPKVPTHCDLRLDQFLIGDGMLFLTDGEEFRLADGARDVGAIAGEWLYRAITGMAGRTVDESGDALGEEPDHAEIVARGVREVDRVRPLIASFWSGYRSARGRADTGLATRATAYAGWHMIDRAMATAMRGSRLPAVSRAAMGIGRNALLRPEKFVSTLGLGDEA
ncbi:class IV lanthionine synthetase subunit LxmK [Streptomyces huasconensis]|nr:class IV lanthionine synthetase subunit LxmK [Streptomyces huasconensis]